MDTDRTRMSESPREMGRDRWSKAATLAAPVPGRAAGLPEVPAGRQHRQSRRSGSGTRPGIESDDLHALARLPGLPGSDPFQRERCLQRHFAGFGQPDAGVPVTAPGVPVVGLRRRHRNFGERERDSGTLAGIARRPDVPDPGPMEYLSTPTEARTGLQAAQLPCGRAIHQCKEGDAHAGKADGRTRSP
jgi:hypothetical protein